MRLPIASSSRRFVRRRRASLFPGRGRRLTRKTAPLVIRLIKTRPLENKTRATGKQPRHPPFALGTRLHRRRRYRLKLLKTIAALAALILIRWHNSQLSTPGKNIAHGVPSRQHYHNPQPDAKSIRQPPRPFCLYLKSAICNILPNMQTRPPPTNMAFHNDLAGSHSAFADAEPDNCRCCLVALLENM